jgi:UDP-N-acetylmuramyl pentapeptide synthase
MIKAFKRALYFPIANYFRFWAKIRLNRWRPITVVVTGSSGKTTLLHLIESQIGKKAKYSHHANSSYGIPFDVLGLKREKLTPEEWIKLFILAPLSILKPIPQEKLYVAEADCDRPGEGEFLANLLNPDITLLISSSLTHSANFDVLVKNKIYSSAEEAIANEFGNFLKKT